MGLPSKGRMAEDTMSLLKASNGGGHRQQTHAAGYLPTRPAQLAHHRVLPYLLAAGVSPVSVQAQPTPVRGFHPTGKRQGYTAALPE